MQTVAVYGEKKSKNLIVSWGSPKGAILDAMELVKKPIKFLQIMYLAPFPTWAVEKELKAAKKVVCVENNYTAQLAGLIRENTGCMIKNKILRYDGRPFEPVQLAKEIKKVF
jgi:2-oxoglutarate ferredoxin oxidoreductase subunit alpha